MSLCFAIKSYFQHVSLRLFKIKKGKGREDIFHTNTYLAICKVSECIAAAGMLCICGIMPTRMDAMNVINRAIGRHELW